MNSNLDAQKPHGISCLLDLLGGEGWLVSSIFRNFVRKSSTEMDSSKTILKLRGMFLFKQMFHQSKTEDFWAPTVSEPPSPP